MTIKQKHFNIPAEIIARDNEWVTARILGFWVQAKVYDVASGEYGIKGGRISKCGVRLYNYDSLRGQPVKGRYVYEYDRGEFLHDTEHLSKAALAEIVEVLESLPQVNA